MNRRGILGGECWGELKDMSDSQGQNKQRRLFGSNFSKAKKQIDFHISIVKKLNSFLFTR